MTRTDGPDYGTISGNTGADRPDPRKEMETRHMETSLTVALGERSYPIHIGPGLLRRADMFREAIAGRQVLVVTNETIAPLYLETVESTLAEHDVASLVLPDGERFKNLETLNRIFDRLLELQYDRSATVVALGGGVIGDLAGFAAASYQRGIHLIQVPTTLLAQVDSSVGGKTGVNHPRGKNMIGAFYQPRLVIADTDTLSTLPDRELRAGLAEVIKYGLIRDAEFFAWLEQSMPALLARDPAALRHAIRRSCEVKAEIVAADERESGVRALLNLGHTFAHAIETGTGYQGWLHGEAVAAGLCMAADLSVRIGWLGEAARGRIVGLVTAAGLPVAAPAALSPERMEELMAVDKKNVGGRRRLVLLAAIGEARVSEAASRGAVLETLRGCRGEPAA